MEPQTAVRKRQGTFKPGNTRRTATRNLLGLALFGPLGNSIDRQPNSKTNTEAEIARTGDLVLDNHLILLDSEILKPHKDPNL